jgi:hypothetical protein
VPGWTGRPSRTTSASRTARWPRASAATKRAWRGPRGARWPGVPRPRGRP